MQTQILAEKQKTIFESLSQKTWLKDFYLAGGTGLALQIGHRLSEDFDFFTEKDFDTLQLAKRIGEDLNFIKVSEDENTLYVLIDGVKASFIGFKYKLISPVTEYGLIKVAGIKDIACMKLSAIAQRSTKKDFIDLYFLLKRYSLTELLQFYTEKFGTNDYEYMLRKSLVYFKDADEDAMPNMLENIEWGEVKSIIEEKALF